MQSDNTAYQKSVAALIAQRYTGPTMSVNATHPEYDASLAAWQRARDVMAGEDAVKAAGETYLPRLDVQSDAEYAAYRCRASFFNATARTADGYVGLVFRRAPFQRLPSPKSSLGHALATFVNDADLLGTSLYGYAKNVVAEVIAVGRVGTLVDWEDTVEHRVYATMYAAESILNWQVQRINGRNIPTLVVLRETVEVPVASSAVDFTTALLEQIRVLRLAALPTSTPRQSEARQDYGCVVEIYRRSEVTSRQSQSEWALVEARTPLRRGKPLPLLPFIFHGPRHSRPAVDKLPLSDVIFLNLDHYRLNADFKHGVHYTALPTAWVSGFPNEASLRIGSSTAWHTETTGATAGFLEFTGHGLNTFEKALDRDERQMAVLGSRLLAEEKKVGETAEAMELRQTGENSILANLATSVSESVTQMLRWVHWWNSSEDTPDQVTDQQVLFELNTDYNPKGMTALELSAVVKSWQAGAISLDTMQELLRKGEILPDGRTNEEEQRLLQQTRPPVPMKALSTSHSSPP